VVFEDGRQLIHGQVTDSGANGLEGSVVGHKGGDVHGRVDGADELRVHQSTGRGAEARSLDAGGDVEGHGQDSIDDVKDAAGEIDILRRFQVSHAVR